MEQAILFDDSRIRGNLLPFTFTRPVGDIRIGILTIKEKWEKHLMVETVYFTEDYLQAKYRYKNIPSLLINGALCPDEALLTAVQHLKPDESLWKDEYLLATNSVSPITFNLSDVSRKHAIQYSEPVTLITQKWHIFQHNGDEIRKDFQLVTKRRISAGSSDPYTHIYNESAVFIEPGAKIKASIINAEAGPVYIGKHTQILEGSLIKGPFALCEGAVLSMGAKMRGDITVGPKCRVGGEVSNSVFFGYSNKSHDGYLGNSVVGQWCNLGANTNVSNLKNNHSPVRVWDYVKGGYNDTGLRFCGSFIGDHSKLGISTMLNTGTVVGVGANVFGEGFPRKLIPSFAWGGASGFSTFMLKKAEDTARIAMELKGEQFEEIDRQIIQRVFDLTRPYRIWEKGF
jgi:UDP-N-acetylglucosamine diphosphorylase/glucosamine-1-phosphate N-acetyltransferase